MKRIGRIVIALSVLLAAIICTYPVYAVVASAQLGPRLWHSYETGSGAISSTTTPNDACVIHEVRIHLSAGSNTQNLTISLDSHLGSAYDVTLDIRDMATSTDYVWRPGQPVPMGVGDGLAVTWANALSRTWGIDVVWSKL